MIYGTRTERHTDTVPVQVQYEYRSCLSHSSSYTSTHHTSSSPSFLFFVMKARDVEGGVRDASTTQSPRVARTKELKEKRETLNSKAMVERHFEKDNKHHQKNDIAVSERGRETAMLDRLEVLKAKQVIMISLSYCYLLLIFLFCVFFERICLCLIYNNFLLVN